MQSQPVQVFWWKGTLCVHLSSKRADSAVDQEIWVSQIASSLRTLQPLFRARLLFCGEEGQVIRTVHQLQGTE